MGTCPTRKDSRVFVCVCVYIHTYNGHLSDEEGLTGEQEPHVLAHRLFVSLKGHVYHTARRQQIRRLRNAAVPALPHRLPARCSVTSRCGSARACQLLYC